MQLFSPTRRQRRSPFWALAGLGAAAVLVSLAAFAVAPMNLDKALAAQVALAEERPMDADVINDLGNLLQLAARPAEAEAAYRRAIDLAPMKKGPHFNLGLLLQHRHELDEALEQFQLTVELDPLDAWAYYQSGTIFEIQGFRDRAIKAYGQALILNPDLAAPQVNPHVIENKLLVEAMIYAYRDRPEPLAPQTYDDADRIANLLIASPPIRASEAEEPEESEAAEELVQAERQVRTPTAQTRFPSSATSDPDEEEDDRDFTGDSPVLDAGAQDRTVQDNRQDNRDQRQQTVVVVPRVVNRDSIDRSAPANQAEPVTGVRTRGSSAAQRSRTTNRATPPRSTGRTRYIPSNRSTGSLEYRLIPAPTAPSDRGGSSKPTR